MWKVGDRVLANRPPDQHWYPGTIRYVGEGQYFILFDDGADQPAGEQQVMALQIEAGDRVQARMPASSTYTGGQVMRVEGDRVNIRYDDDTEEWTSVGMIRVDRSNWKSSAPAQRSQKWIVGDRVLAKWTGDPFFWYPATVQQILRDQFLLYYDDGDKEWLRAQRMAPMDLRVGSKIYCRFQTGPVYYYGRIASMNGEQIHVEYEDGGREDTTLSMVRVLRPVNWGRHNWEPGERVFAPWQAEPWYYPGVVRGVQGQRVLVQFRDGDQGYADQAQLLPMELEASERVLAYYAEDDGWFPARVLSRNGDRLYIEYEADGYQEWTAIANVGIAPYEWLERHEGSGEW